MWDGSTYGADPFDPYDFDSGFHFGWAGVAPVVGDWNGDGRVDAGVFNDGSWYLDYNGNGAWNGFTTDRGFSFGWSGTKPVVANW